MICTWCDTAGAQPRRKHAERILCDRCNDRPPLVNWLHPPAPPDPSSLLTTTSTTSQWRRKPEAPRPLERIDDRVSWRAANLEPIIAGRQPDEPPAILARPDGVHLLYRARLHSVNAEPESGKGWLACQATVEQLAAGENVVYIDYEDTPAAIVSRLRALGADDDAILARLHYVRPDEPVGESGPGALVDVGAALVMIDGVTEALAVEGLDLASNQDVAEFYKRLAHPFANAGSAVLLLDHVVKDREHRGRYALGAGHKLAGVDVAYRLDVAQPFGREREGLVKVTVMKDRPGFVREHAADRERIAMMRLTSSPNGNVDVTLDAPENAGSPFRPTTIMERISKALEAETGLTRNAIRATVKGKGTYVDLALELLANEGFIDIRPDGQARRHYSVNPYRVPVSQPFPDRFPETVEGPGPRVPPPTGTRTRDSANQTHDRFPDLERAERLAVDHADLNQEAA
jgi:hypothetical protein